MCRKPIGLYVVKSDNLRMPADRIAFVEHKSHIRMSKDDSMNEDSISEALRVGCEKWGGIKITGSEEFKKLAFQKAAELGLSHFVTVEFTAPNVSQNVPIPLKL